MKKRGERNRMHFFPSFPALVYRGGGSSANEQMDLGLMRPKSQALRRGSQVSRLDLRLESQISSLKSRACSCRYECIANCPPHRSPPTAHRPCPSARWSRISAGGLGIGPCRCRRGRGLHRGFASCRTFPWNNFYL